jgi:hypothetical protein
MRACFNHFKALKSTCKTLVSAFILHKDKRLNGFHDIPVLKLLQLNTKLPSH